MCVPVRVCAQSFSTLEFEIQMTQMAANSLFGYWSHDIGVCVCVLLVRVSVCL